mmetsp:Transcript_36745/g.32961  ORF Transcript_36745/g.32961 Transcript_36745/m.32961 type:complete len:138 (+) Transcript_36745:725-1138(+)
MKYRYIRHYWLLLVYTYSFIFIPLNLAFTNEFSYEGNIEYQILEVVVILALTFDLGFVIREYHLIKKKVKNQIVPAENASKLTESKTVAQSIMMESLTSKLKLAYILTLEFCCIMPFAWILEAAIPNDRHNIALIAL